MADIKELEQSKSPEVQEKYLTESEVRAIVSESLTNLQGNIRLLSGQISNLSNTMSITPTGTTITALSSGSMPAIQGWTSTLTFSSTDADTVSWSSGTIILSDGTTYTISSGNTGNMSAITYIYLDISVSTTVLQTSTTASNSVGTNRLLIAVAQNSAVEAIFQSFGGKGGLLITTDNLAADSITANEVNINTLSAISADLGTITAGTVTGAVIQTATSGYRIKMNYSTNKIELLNGDTVLASVYVDSSGDIILNGTDDVNLSINGAIKCYAASGGFKPNSDGSYDLGETGNSWRYVRAKRYDVKSTSPNTGITQNIKVMDDDGSTTKHLVFKGGILVDSYNE